MCHNFKSNVVYRSLRICLRWQFIWFLLVYGSIADPSLESMWLCCSFSFSLCFSTLASCLPRIHSVRSHNKICHINIFCATKSVIKSTFQSHQWIGYTEIIKKKTVCAIRFLFQNRMRSDVFFPSFDVLSLDMNWYLMSVFEVDIV